MTHADASELERQYDWIKNGTGVVAVPPRDAVEVTGRDRATFLHNLCTNDVKRLAPGEGCEAFFTNVQGKIVGHGYLFCQAESILVDTVGGQAAALLSHLDRYLIREDVQLTDRSGELHRLIVSGAKIANVLQGLVSDIPVTLLCHGTARMAGVEIAVRRVNWTGPEGFLLQVPVGAIETVQSALEGAGASRVHDDLFEMMRVEQGVPVFGQDMDDGNLPQEVDRNEVAISFTKGCYLGQETVARIDALGHVNRQLTGLRFDGVSPPPSGLNLRVGEKAVGKVTSAVMSIATHGPLAMGYVRREYLNAETTFETDCGSATVVRLPVA